MKTLFQFDGDTQNNMEPISSTGIGKGLASTVTALFGLSVWWTEVGEVLKIVTAALASLGSIFLLGCGIYDRFFRKPSNRRRHK